MTEINNYKQKLFYLINTDKTKITNLTITYKKFLRKHDIKTNAMLLNLLQMPFYFIWFFSLKNLLGNEVVMDGIKNNSFLYINNLGVSDPYFVLPLLASFATYYSISCLIKEQKKNNMNSDPNLEIYFRYVKFFPIFSFCFLAYLPAGLNLYFMTLMISNQVVHNLIGKFVKKYYEIPEYFEGTELHRLAQEKELREEFGDEILKEEFVEVGGDEKGEKVLDVEFEEKKEDREKKEEREGINK